MGDLSAAFPPPRALALWLLGALVAPALGGVTGFLGITKVSREDAQANLLAELAKANWSESLALLEGELGQTYAALPKNPSGRVGHSTARYALHRYFMKQYGWFIRGLEPKGGLSTRGTDLQRQEFSTELAPAYLLDFLEGQLGTEAVSLRELAVVAAAVKDLVHNEEVGRLQKAYEALDFPLEGELDDIDGEEALDIYMLIYFLGGNVTAKSPTIIRRKRKLLGEKSKAWVRTEKWLHDFRRKYVESGEATNFSRSAQLVQQLGENYVYFNDKECKGLKKMLLEMEDTRRGGRVRLPDFYKKGLFGEWELNEKVEYLRALGTLDESDQSQPPAVIVPNYMGSFTNCLKSSGFYAVCCRNECEDLMGQLEKQLGGPSATPVRIAEIVARLPSDTVKAPRLFSPALLRRLHEVAANNGGQVPLHGRLFAQWMHHAYPRECPYPHEAGTTNPMTPDEWMQETGHEDTAESEAERRRHAEGATCSFSAEGKPMCHMEVDGQAGDELPWSSSEELLVSNGIQRLTPRREAQAGDGIMRGLLWCLALAVALGLGRRKYLSLLMKGSKADELNVYHTA